MHNPYPYTLSFTRRFTKYEFSTKDSLGFCSIASARKWIKAVQAKESTLDYRISEFNIARTV